MKAGILVYSQSGHTAAFARAIADRFRETGIDYGIELLRPHGVPKPFGGTVEFRRLPEIDEYDVLLFGAPVWVGAPCRVILAYCNGLTSLKGKTALPFVTHGLPWKVLGANRSLKKMSEALEELHAEVLPGESHFFFFFRSNKAQMHEAAGRIAARVKACA